MEFERLLELIGDEPGFDLNLLTLTNLEQVLD